jgi:hypothetical protein
MTTHEILEEVENDKGRWKFYRFVPQKAWAEANAM